MDWEAQLASLLETYVDLADKPPCSRCTPGMAPVSPSATPGEVLHPEWDKWARANMGKDDPKDMDPSPKGVPQWIKCPDCNGNRFLPAKPWASTLTKLIDALKNACPYPHNEGDPRVTFVECMCGYRYDASAGELKEKADD